MNVSVQVGSNDDTVEYDGTADEGNGRGEESRRKAFHR